MPKIETFKIKVKYLDKLESEWMEVPGVGFEYRGERFFYRADIKSSTVVEHVGSGKRVGFIDGRHSLKAAKEVMDKLVERHGWPRMESVFRGHTEKENTPIVER